VIKGMSCEHCASAMRAEVGRLPWVTGVDVAVAAGTVLVTGEPVPGDAVLREAIEETGYEFAGTAKNMWSIAAQDAVEPDDRRWSRKGLRSRSTRSAGPALRRTLGAQLLLIRGTIQASVTAGKRPFPRPACRSRTDYLSPLRCGV